MDIYSVTKAVYHTDRIKALQNKESIAPTLIQLDLESFCNDSCTFCSYRKPDGYNNKMLSLINATPGALYDENKPIGQPTEKGRLPKEIAASIPNMMKEAGIPAIELTGGGEPTLWPWFDELIKNLVENGIQIGLVTNGSNLSKDRIKLLAKSLTWIRFSMDSANEKIHQKVHRTHNLDFHRRLEHLKELIIERKDSDITIGISFIITPENKNDVESAIKLFKKIGVDNIRFSWMFDKSGKSGLNGNDIEQLKMDLNHHQRIYSNDMFKVLFESGRIDTYSQPNDDFDTCYMQHFVWAIGADCLVYPCCIVKYWPKLALADIREKTLEQIIQDQQVKKQMLELDVKQCPPCWLRPRNKAIGNAVEKPMHENFI